MVSQYNIDTKLLTEIYSRPKVDEKKNKPGHQSRSFSRNSQNTVSRPQSRNNTKTPLKRQNSLDLPVSPRQPLAAPVPSLQQPLAEQPQGKKYDVCI